MVVFLRLDTGLHPVLAPDLQPPPVASLNVPFRGNAHDSLRGRYVFDGIAKCGEMRKEG